MIRYLIAATVLLLPASAAPPRVVFEGAESEHKGTLKDVRTGGYLGVPAAHEITPPGVA